MQIVPLQAVPAQTLVVTLANQITQISLRQWQTGLFMDVALNNEPVVTGVLCENLNRIVRSLYLGYSGDFAFIDNQGSTDPDYTGLGARFSLAYLTVAELTELPA